MTYRPPTGKALVLTAVVALTASAGLFVTRPVDVIVDGTRLDSDVAPVATANQVYVPLRSLADALGARTILAAKGDAVAIVRGSDALHLRIGARHATLDGMPMTLDHAPFVVRGRIMIGLESISRAFGVRTSYDAIAGRVEVMTPGIGEAPPSANLTAATQ
jgi:hypothetical protein